MDRDFKTFRFRLREETTLLHKRLESRLAVSGLSGRRDDYTRMLGTFLSFYRPLEVTLQAFEWQTLGINISERMKTGWLLTDLHRCGIPSNNISDWNGIPRITSAVEGLGALYVIEGASLGGKVISRQLQNEWGINEANGGRFFMSYGDRVGEMWKSFLVALENAAKAENNATIITRAALQTFESFDACVAASDQPCMVATEKAG